jgi:hypothetical protein
MMERHYYESNLQMGNCHYDLLQVQPSLLQYFKEHSQPVFEYHPLENDNLWGFHQDGISIHLQTTNLSQDELHFVDVKLISEVTPTQNLEDRLKKIVEPFKK